jgi:ketosteroid isomerase-like protein
VSIWRFESGAWKLAIDLGIVHEETKGFENGIRRVAPASETMLLTDDLHAELARELLYLERSLASVSDTASRSEAYLNIVADDIRFCRSDRPPTVGKAALAKLLSGRPGKVTWAPDTAVVSRSGDLAYTYGSMTLRAPSEPAPVAYSYVRIWRHGPIGWTLALDIALPHPPAKP